MSEYLKQSKKFINSYKTEISSYDVTAVEKLRIIYIITLIIIPIGALIYTFQHAFIFKDNIEIYTILFLAVCFIYLLWQVRLTNNNPNLAKKLGRIYFYFPVTFIWLFEKLSLFNPKSLEIDIVSPPIFIIILLLNCTIIYGYKDLTYLMIVSLANFLPFSLFYITNIPWILDNTFLIIVFYFIFLIALHLNNLTEKELLNITKKEEEKRNLILENTKNHIKLYNSISHEFLTPVHSIQANLDEIDQNLSPSTNIALKELYSTLESIKFWSFYLIDYNELNKFFVLNNSEIKLNDLVTDLYTILLNNPSFITNEIMMFIDSVNKSILTDKIRVYLIIVDTLNNLSMNNKTNKIILNFRVASDDNNTECLNVLITQESAPNQKLLGETTEEPNNLFFVELNRKLVKQMYGKLCYEVTKQSLIYSISIPLREDSITEKQLLQEIEYDHSIERSILIVDDSKDNRFIIKSYLKDYKINFVEAEDGEKGLKLLQSDKNFDLVLMDIRMPVMDGIEVTRKFREWEKNNRETRTTVVFLTAYLNDVIDSEELEKLVDERILNKPFKKEDLLKILSDI